MDVEGYDTLSFLGSGQYGDVFLVRRKRDQRLFAAKASNNYQAAAASSVLAQVKWEAELMQRLHHVNIIQCVDIVEKDRQHVIIMEYASGGDLDAYLRSSRAK